MSFLWADSSLMPRNVKLMNKWIYEWPQIEASERWERVQSSESNCTTTKAVSDSKWVDVNSGIIAKKHGK